MSFPKTVKLILSGTLLTLTGCATGVLGETVAGRPGSVMWFKTASSETQVNYFTNICKSYGFNVGTVEMSQCIQSESVNARNRSSSRLQNSINSNRTINCTTFGNTTTCR
jgi:hypothetical protein